ncbi:hypothetical protein LJ753_16765 [Arthrobacter sp. zg-Y20]|uniref:hypothetical protein n=1 Tax=unclassified Arthrobacter TaxID=235627 RepID=UPI001D14CDA7|nr:MULTISPECIES: hypothetical protein [unclassified Arthrobacter]MCC3277518.1 hypothetical protein [Arthrobacter sp. zg-Y20]MDK1317678.1 hypothetical protein [Arthrobacter sp. zg.Y20]WIB07063.1 hypothetical protein QNO06_04865 [Arthrobacter sp. zg-Y20]
MGQQTDVLDRVLRDACNDAEQGLTVAFIAPTRAAGRAALRQLKDNAPAGAATFYMTNGAEEIRMHSGGRVFLSVPKGGIRGTNVDHIYIPAKMETPDVMEELAPAVATSDHPAIVGYFV